MNINSSTLNSDKAPIEFDIKGQGDEYLDLSQTYLQVVCKFTMGDWTNLTGNHRTSTPINNILHSLLTEIDVSLNSKIIDPGKDIPLQSLSRKITLLQPQNLSDSNDRLYPVGEKHARTHGRSRCRCGRICSRRI